MRYDYGYGEYLGNENSGSCRDNDAVVGIPAQGSSSRVSFALNVDPAVMNSADNNLAANWSFSTNTYDADNGQVGTPGVQNNEVVSSTNNLLLGKEISIYPNPANTMINVVSDLDGELEMEIYNIIGTRMKQIQVDRRNISVAQLPVGVYTLRISVEGASVTRKIVIQR